MNNKNKFKILIILIFFITTYGQNFTKNPYLARPEEKSITIRWESDKIGDFTIKYGKDSTLTLTEKSILLSDRDERFLYESTLDNLYEGTTYYYQVTSEQTSSKISTFNSIPPKNQPLNFAVIGDSRSKHHIFSAISEQIKNKEPDIIIASGDLVANGGNFEQWNSHYFKVAEKTIDHIPLITALGDHEAGGYDGDAGELFSHFLFPDKDYKKLWYSVNYGDAHFIFLDYRHPQNEEMIEWFKKDMDTNKSKWKFVIMHRPCYNLGGHFSKWGKEIWPSLFAEYEIDIVFAGHSHLYERFFPMADSDSRPVTYITSGGAGASLYEAGKHPILAFTKSINHYVYVSLDNDRLKLKTFLPDGSILDEIEWSKNEKGINKEYLELVKSQEEFNLVRIFANSISQSLDRLPMVRIPAEPQIKLESFMINEDIDFEIILAEESKESYIMDKVSAKLLKDDNMVIPLKIYAKETMTVSKWGSLNPTLRLIVNYKSNSFEGKIIGKALSYRAY